MHIPRRSAHVFVKYWGNEYSKVIGLLWDRANVHSGYCPVVRISGRANFYQASVHGLLYGQVTVRSGYYLVGLLSDRVTVCRLSVHGLLSQRDVS